ncbi:MAG TPA: hypothetical protein VGF63_04125 [Solirubrobacteraceae bacterium]
MAAGLAASEVPAHDLPRPARRRPPRCDVQRRLEAVGLLTDTGKWDLPRDGAKPRSRVVELDVGDRLGSHAACQAQRGRQLATGESGRRHLRSVVEIVLALERVDGERRQRRDGCAARDQARRAARDREAREAAIGAAQAVERRKLDAPATAAARKTTPQQQRERPRERTPSTAACAVAGFDRSDAP